MNFWKHLTSKIAIFPMYTRWVQRFYHALTNPLIFCIKILIIKDYLCDKKYWYFSSKNFTSSLANILKLIKISVTNWIKIILSLNITPMLLKLRLYLIFVTSKLLNQTEMWNGDVTWNTTSVFILWNVYSCSIYSCVNL